MKIQFDLGLFNSNLNEARKKKRMDDITANYHRDNPMSVQAHKIAHKFKISYKQEIIKHLQDWSLIRHRVPMGLTCEELESYTGLSHQTCSARLSELRREGKIKIIGTRKTRSGSPAAVYQAI